MSLFASNIQAGVHLLDRQDSGLLKESDLKTLETNVFESNYMTSFAGNSNIRPIALLG